MIEMMKNRGVTRLVSKYGQNSATEAKQLTQTLIFQHHLLSTRFVSAGTIPGQLLCPQYY